MKKFFSLALGVLMSLSAWSFDNVPATFTWTVGNENEATVASDASDGVQEANVKAGIGLTVDTYTNYAANPGKTMTTYKPAENKPGAVATAMVEYRVKMKKGVTFTLTNVSYEALKEGTNDASYKWSYAVDGTESAISDVAKDDILRNDNSNASSAQLTHTHTITATAGREVAFRIYVSGFANTKRLALSNIVLTGTIDGEEEVRTFTDFKIEFRDNPFTVLLPEGGVLPQGVEVDETTYNGGQHGVQGGYINVQVDGPVKFTIGACQFSQTDITVRKNGEDFATISNNAPCGEQKPNYNQYITWTYNVEEPAMLTFAFGSQTFVPYFFAEACEFVPEVEVRYYDVDGKTLIGEPQIVEGGSALSYAYGANDVTVADGKAFRGWFNGSVTTATKVAEGTPLTENLSLYAKATDIEVAEVGKIYDYDLTKNYFYQEDHELFSVVGGHAHSDINHGWVFGNGNTMSIQVAGNALIAVDVCKYSNTSTTELKDFWDNKVGELNVERDVTADGSKQTIYYEGPATTLTFYFTATNYIHHLKVYNVASLPQKDTNTGYYILSSGDAAGLILVLESLQDGDKIFLPNGVYDLGEAALTQISKNNVSIIGQSMEGTIIKNAPDFHNEGIGTTATIFIPENVSGTYFQDLTLHNGLDYFAAIAAGLSGARAVCLQDKGTQTICKNVRMLSNQDTYYSNKIGALKYFETCEIHGTVDFICGDGSVYFKGTELVCEQRNANGGGADAVTASNADATDKGYVFDHCTIRYAEGIQGTLPIVSLGRSWNNSPKTVFLYTFLDDSNGALNMYKDAQSQKDKVSRWTLGAMNALPELFGEYYSVNAQGENITPSSNNVTFVLNSDEKPMETVLTAEQAAVYTMDYTLGSWATTAAADAAQVECEEQWADLDPNAIYLAENEGRFVMLVKGSDVMNNLALYDGETYILRKANARGGFGLPAGEEPVDPTEGCEQVSTERAAMNGKIIRDGRVIIVRDGRMYDILGNELVK